MIFQYLTTATFELFSNNGVYLTGCVISPYVPLLPSLNHRFNAMAISERLVHPLENPSGDTPIIPEPVKAEIPASKKPKAASPIITKITFRIRFLLSMQYKG